MDADATRSAAPELVEPGSPPPQDLGDVFVDEPERYAVAGAIGAGGMGTVLAAKGSRLGRPVAIKVVTAGHEEVIRRFEREAQVTARLQHPAIVPVYGSGRGKNGQPFYAMKQVTGDALDKVIAKASTLAERIALVPNVIAVVEAIAYAHGEHVIHRDLKPANILVGGFGETVVIDWGLAKDLSRADEDADTVSPYRSPSSGDETAAGRVMGTPAYMPREQARGDKVDERADVYALGAILYHVLAGVSPYTHEGETGTPWETKLARVLAGPPTPLEQLQPEAPPDLVAIIAKAMARDPADRYPTANELARDLRRFQTGQLVGAHRYSSWQLVKRWLRRHRTAVSVAGVAFALLVTLGVVSMTSIVAERDRTEAQRVAAVKGRNDAEGLAAFMLVDVRDRLKALGRLDLLDEVVKRAGTYYASLPEPADDIELSSRAVLAIDIGDVLRLRGDRAGALVRFQEALADDLKLVANDSSDDRRSHELGVVHGRFCEMLGETDVDGALPHCHAARDINAKLAAAHPTDVSEVEALAISEFDVAGAVRSRDIAEATRVYRSAIVHFQKAVALAPDSIELQRYLADTHKDLANLLSDSSDLAGARAEFRHAKTALEALHAKVPNDTQNTYSLATTELYLADMLLAAHDARGALEEAKPGTDLLATLAANDPTNQEPRWALARGLYTLGKTQQAVPDLDAAKATFHRMIEITDRLVIETPDNTRNLNMASEAHRDLADALALAADTDGALAEYRTALDLNRRMAGKVADDHDRQTDIVSISSAVGDLLQRRRDATGAVAAYRAADAACTTLLAGEPGSFPLKQELAAVRVKIGNALAASNDRAGAKTAYDAALALAEPLAMESPDDREVHAILVEAREARAKLQ